MEGPLVKVRRGFVGQSPTLGPGTLGDMWAAKKKSPQEHLGSCWKGFPLSRCIRELFSYFLIQSLTVTGQLYISVLQKVCLFTLVYDVIIINKKNG